MQTTIKVQRQPIIAVAILHCTSNQILASRLAVLYTCIQLHATLCSSVGGTTQTEKGLAGLPYVKFRQATNERRYPLDPTLSKYESVVEHKIVPRHGVNNQLNFLESQSSITAQYASTYDYAQGEMDYTSVGYYYVPPAVSLCTQSMQTAVLCAFRIMSHMHCCSVV